MDIEERAERWVIAQFDTAEFPQFVMAMRQALKRAYLAGVDQARKDEAAYHEHIRNLDQCPVCRRY